MTPVTVTLSPKEIKVIKCNGVGSCKKKKHNMYTIPPDYLSHIVVIGKCACAVASFDITFAKFLFCPC